MEPDGPWDVCAALAAQFRNPDGTDRWRVWPIVNDVSLYYAWCVGSEPPAVPRDRTLAGLKARMELFEDVYAATQDWVLAMAAAQELET